MKKIGRLAAIFLTIIMVMSSEMVAFAREKELDFQIYETKLEELNSRFGTSYQLTPADGESYDDMENYFKSMSLDEFEQYICDCNAADRIMKDRLENKLTVSLGTKMSGRSIISRNVGIRSALDKQKFFYYGNSNYLFLSAYTTDVSGVTVYTGDINSVGYSISTYPGYRTTSYTYSFAADKRTVLIVYSCSKYLSKYVTDATLYTIKVIYGAGEGDVYPVV